jgi:hypothetical protein
MSRAVGAAGSTTPFVSAAAVSRCSRSSPPGATAYSDMDWIFSPSVSIFFLSARSRAVSNTFVGAISAGHTLADAVGGGGRLSKRRIRRQGRRSGRSGRSGRRKSSVSRFKTKRVCTGDVQSAGDVHRRKMPSCFVCRSSARERVMILFINCSKHAACRSCWRRLELGDPGAVVAVALCAHLVGLASTNACRIRIRLTHAISGTGLGF